LRSATIGKEGTFVLIIIFLLHLTHLRLKIQDDSVPLVCGIFDIIFFGAKPTADNRAKPLVEAKA